MVFTSALTDWEVYALYSGLNCMVCAANSYCGGNSVNLQTPCPNNTYSYSGASTVSQCGCPVNAAWIQDWNCTCNPGYYTVPNSAVLGGWQCNPCPIGSYCYLGAITTCPVNTTSPALPEQLCVCHWICVLSDYSNPTLPNLCSRRLL